LKRAVLLATLLGVAAPFASRVPSPLVDTVLALHQALTTPTLKLPGMPARARDLAVLDRSQLAPAALATPFKKVLVFVMETMTVEQLERERKALPTDTFVNAAPARAHRYTRYFPGNQDSRTGMLGMLSSRFIPYEAYTEEGRDRYMFLRDRTSLVQHMDRLGFDTAFVVSQEELELVVTDLPWKHLLHLGDGDLERARKADLLCFVPYEFEHSCEDRALLPDVLSLIDSTERLFLYQEFIWGHASEYNEASGRTNTDYYSRYLDAIVEHLRERDLLEETLIVLTADHGFRGTDEQHTLAAYHIPLLFQASSFEPRSDDRLFSHIDFADLLFHELAKGSAAPPERPFTLVMGPTKSSFFMALTAQREFMLFKSREGQHWLLRHGLLDARGRELRALEDRATPARMLRLFYDYRAAFDNSARPAAGDGTAQGAR
jgi:hypothetical protein